MKPELKILLLENNATDIGNLRAVLTRSEMNFDLHVVESRDYFISSLEDFNPDIVVAGNSSPDISSLEALEIARRKNSDIPFILVTGPFSEQFAVNCIRAGVDDYILKDNLIRLPLSIDAVVSKAIANREKETILSMHQELKLAYSAIEENNKSMMDSINYAKLIQDAMLPEKAVLTNYFPNSLIIYRPKDIVSGDFYWFVERDKKLFIAVADCTGHGVPGSLMSMIGYSFLNEIVNVKKIRKPSDILSRLNVGIRQTLKQDKTGNQRCDGMDIALCAIDREMQQIEFAGANRHLIFFRDKELEMVRGNKFGIGGLHDESVIRFTNHSISYDDGDIIYMCTDGYADQFGGTKGKRMMTKNMIKILEKSLSFGVGEQEQLLNHWLDKWQGAYEQTDDILLIGIQL
ncbi:PP2C family protein-serine/threonine phosphatase [Aurantibacillus circumpalustris]|uniref:PP2C family protein-serine/threonine phosphatase n=1 Tax=Aurantibacillus circumpalustris TaxID=3036359 RepID=UPI00295A84F9|nr:SpoIIE family protein phosphatase [Aurantibacillus circumpalustris]